MSGTFINLTKIWIIYLKTHKTSKKKNSTEKWTKIQTFIP